MFVALRKESVDRNLGCNYPFKVFKRVALRKESVDRNTTRMCINKKQHVALRKESVYRNTIISQTVSEIIGSLSARRAWIEICCL